METVSLYDVPHRELRALFARRAPVWMLVNPVEYHGPHLSLHNDRLISLGVARDVHARMSRDGAPLLLADDVEVGVDPTPGPGTRVTTFREARATVMRACQGLAAIGARSVVAMTWHGAPLHSLAIEPGLAWLRARGVRALNPFGEAFRELCRLDGARFAAAFAHVEDRELRARMIDTLRYDFHGGFFETSMALHYAPRSVSAQLGDVPPCPPFAPVPRIMRMADGARRLGRRELADELAMIAHGLAWRALDPFPGYTGAPALARAESGAVFAEVIASGYAEMIRDVLDGVRVAPRPPMAWVRALTLGGRLAPA